MAVLKSFVVHLLEKPYQAIRHGLASVHRNRRPIGDHSERLVFVILATVERRLARQLRFDVSTAAHEVSRVGYVLDAVDLMCILYVT